MNTRPKLVLAALLTCTTLLAGCNSSPEDRLAEPEISFPAKETSTSPAPDDDDAVSYTHLTLPTTPYV